MPLSHFLFAILLVTIWGFNFIAIRVGLDEIPPIFLAFLRFFLTAVPLVFFIKRPSVPWKWLLSYGVFMFALQFAFLFMGMYAGVSVGLTSVLTQSHVFFSIFLAALFLDERVRIWQILGAVVAFSGIALVAKHAHTGATGGGLLFVLSAAACWSTGTVLSKKIGRVEILSLVVWASLIACPILFTASYLIEGRAQILYALQNLTWISSGAVLYITYLATLFGFCAWNWLLRHHPVGKVAPFTLLVPIIGLLSSAWIFGEPLQAWKLIAAVLVITGLCMNLFGPLMMKK